MIKNIKRNFLGVNKLIVTFILIVGILLQGYTVSIAAPKNVGKNEEKVIIGVLSFISKDETLDKWTPLAEYLTDFIPNVDFEIEPLFYTEFDDAISNKQIDYIFTNPAHYIALGEKFNISGPIATLTESSGGKTQAGFGGVIFVKNKPGTPRSLKALSGETISAVDLDSLGGYLASAYELKKIGINPDNQVNFMFTGMPHCNSVHLVMDGKVDAGFARTGVIEGMIESGIIESDDLIILNEQNIPGFDQHLSTVLYPEWPLIALPHIKPQQAQRVAASLFLMDEYSEYIDSIGISGFTIPASYLPVELLMITMKIPPFDNNEPITLSLIWREYSFEILIFLVLIITVSSYAIYKSRISKILTMKNQELNNLTNQLQNINSNLMEISSKDSLTALYNRRYFEIFLKEKLEEAKTNDDSLSLCVIDIDNFKFYNDKYGHSIGDRVLKEVAKTLQEHIQHPLDLVARYAGDGAPRRRAQVV